MESILTIPDVERGYEEYALADLVDGTFLEVPADSVAKLLLSSPDGELSAGPEEVMAEQSFFLDTRVVDGTIERVLVGVFGDNHGVDSFVWTSAEILCRIITAGKVATLGCE